MNTDRASVIQHEVDQLIELQIITLKQKSSLTEVQLRDYHLRAEKIQTLYKELDRIHRSKLAVKVANAS